ncbi:hypothetical protein [Paenibacillus sp. IITD108]|uniref:hypothetical protein n=1 Tax=Paenibacillus sp. IITD108 TaxID=3116649 RepID=UPI002F42941A
MKFDYQLSGIGWAEVEIEINNQNTYCNPSYISEPLIDLINGLVSITPGCIADDELKDEVTFEWNEEPGGDIWYLKRVNNKDLMVKIISYSDLFNKDQSTVRVNMDTICDLEEFIRSVVIASGSLLKKHGFVGYRKTWCRHDFPISGYLILKKYIESKKVYPVTNIFFRGNYDLVSSDLEDEFKTLFE